MSIEPTAGFIPSWTLGDRLRKARVLTGLTTRDFADRIGVSHGTITNAELDKRAVRPITIKAWALATGVDVDWLEHGTTKPRPGGPVGASDECAIKDSNLEPTDSEHAAERHGSDADVIPLPLRQPAPEAVPA